MDIVQVVCGGEDGVIEPDTILALETAELADIFNVYFQPSTEVEFESNYSFWS